MGKSPAFNKATRHGMRNAVARKRQEHGKFFADPGDKAISEANRCHQEAKAVFGPFLRWAREAGQWLTTAKREVEGSGGRWRIWLEEKIRRKEFTGSVRTAQGYMRVFNNWCELEEKPNLSLRKALQGLATKKPKQSQSSEKQVEEKLLREMLGASLRDWTLDEKRWLAERLPDADFQLDCEELLTAAFVMLRESVRRAIDSEKLKKAA